MTDATPPSAVTPARCDPDNGGAHPLEFIPIFRRIPRSIPRDIVYTLIWNTLFAVGFTMLNLVFDSRETFTGTFWPTFVFAQCIGFIIHGLFLIGDWVLPDINSHGGWVRAFYYTIVPLLGTFAGYVLAAALLHIDTMRAWLFAPRGAFVVGTISVIISSSLLLIFAQRARVARMEAAFEHERARVAAAEREATLAQLKLLEAQVEPHFLYNTLANIVSLVDSDPATAKRMIERLIALLRGAALAAGKEGEGGSLAAQIDHLRAYLDLMALRMGGRLTFGIDMAPDVAPLHLPPLLLQPLVENAIRHGLEPKVEGGDIHIVARRDGDTLVLVVADTGIGFAATRAKAANGGGLGLPNVRDRLDALYGRAAAMVIEDNAPSGARVTLRVPVGVNP